jgi:ABC-type uncharacterized transport system fused permease/ATPase subunit
MVSVKCFSKMVISFVSETCVLKSHNSGFTITCLVVDFVSLYILVGTFITACKPNILVINVKRSRPGVLVFKVG